MAMANDNIKELEEKIKNLPAGKERDLWQKVLDEARRFEVMTDKEIAADLKKSDEEAALAEEQLKLLEMDREKREKEVTKLQAEAKQKKEEAEREWKEALAAVAPTLIEEDVARRKAEAAAEDKIETDKTEELIEALRSFLGENDLAGAGAVLRKLAVSGRLGETLNRFGYPSNIGGLHEFFNKEVIGERPVLGDAAYENLLYQQRAYSMEQDLSCLAGGAREWSLAFAVGREERIWQQLSEEEHLLAVADAAGKIDGKAAARLLGGPAYGSFGPAASGRGDFSLGGEGKIILLNFADVFEKQLRAGEFNPGAAAILAKNSDQLEALGLKASFSEALKNYAESLGEPEAAGELIAELEK